MNLSKILTFLLLFNSFELVAGIESVKLEKGIHLKFDNANWDYQYIKMFSSITPHVLESKIEKGLKVIVQKETHGLEKSNQKSLIEEKCSAANKFYQDAKQGSAKTIEIKNQKVCFIQLAKQEKNTYQIMYPVNFSKSSYDLISFAWNDVDEKNLKAVSSLVGENL
jgi:hypothetical protein